MKKLLISLVLTISLVFALSSCSVLGGILDSVIPSDGYEFEDFSTTEKSLFEKYIGEVIPFIPNDEYYIEGYYSKNDFENGLNFYTIGNSADDFNKYLSLFSEYELVDTYQDEYGYTWHCYIKGDVEVELSYYEFNGENYIDVFVKSDLCKDDNTGDNTGNNGDNTDDNTGSNGDNTGSNNGNTGSDGNDNGNNTGGDDSGNTGNDGNDDNTSIKHIYTDFSATEKDMFIQLFDTVIPFIPNDDYYVEAYTYEDEIGINYYTFYNAESEFEAYRALFSSYTFVESYEDMYGDTWYSYKNDSFYLDMSYYITEENESCVDIYVYIYSNGGNIGGSDGGNGNNHLYSDFTSSEKELFNEYFGVVIPFIENSDYYVEEYTFENEVGINYYTFGNTKSEFTAYLDEFSAYTFIEITEDYYGDTWYTYQLGDFYVDMAYYITEDNESCVDIFIYIYPDENQGGNGDDTINNGNAGLPSDEDGVFDIDFTDAENVKNVTDQGYYLDGCPTTGTPGVLVIPVDFSDVTASDKGYSTEAIANAFLKNGQCDYFSVYDYYYISSYGQLELDITVLDFWFRPKHPSTYYADATIDYYGEDLFIGDQIIMDEALAYLSTFMDLSDYDSDGNGIIDSVVLINTLEINAEDTFYWAYRYWNMYTDDEEYYYEYDGVSANDYLWASYQFLFQTYDSEGYESFDDPTAMNTYTFIHEFGHILGADDYYDTAGVNDPMGGCDVMDAMSGDHNAFTKFNFGWLTASRLVVASDSITLKLQDFAKSGDTIIIANNWDASLGAYQEYYIVAYYTNTVLNDHSVGGGYFARDGVVVYHVNSSLYKDEIDGDIYYDIYNNNTDYSDDYGTKNNLIEFVLSENDTYTYVVGDTLPNVKDDIGIEIPYTFVVDALEEEYATLTFTKN